MEALALHRSLSRVRAALATPTDWAIVLSEASAHPRVATMSFASNWTPLHAAAAQGRGAAAALLVVVISRLGGAAVQAALRVCDAGGRSPMHVAARCDRSGEVVSVLLAAGADVEDRGGGAAPLGVAVQARNGAAVRALIRAGADVWRDDGGGMSPAEIAAGGTRRRRAARSQVSGGCVVTVWPRATGGDVGVVEDGRWSVGNEKMEATRRWVQRNSFSERSNGGSSGRSVAGTDRLSNWTMTSG